MKHRTSIRAGLIAAAAWAALQGAASAAPIDLGDDRLQLNFDNTFKYSAGWRVKEASPALTANPNLDDGDRNFSRGLISNRLDILSEVDLTFEKRYGARLSGAAWYDTVYNRSNDNPGFAGGAFPNQSGAYNAFPGATRNLHGRRAELLDAFVFGTFDLGGHRTSVRLGRHSVIWGETLFFGANGIAGGMSPVDVIKLLSVPSTQFKEAIRPVPQISLQTQLAPNLSAGAFYQFSWQASRLPAVGSYFSGADTNPEGAEQIYFPGVAAPRLADQTPKDAGQGGVQLRWRLGETDLGFYAVRFHNKVQQQVFVAGLSPFPVGYRLAYHQGIVAYGTSLSHTFGDVNLAAEASLRRNQDLASTGAIDLTAFGLGGGDNSGDPGYAVGKTAHVNVSALWTVPATPLWNEASFTGEAMWNRMLSVTKNAAALDQNGTRDAYAFRLLFEPTYRQVVGGLDVGVPLSLGYSPRGSRSLVLGPALPPENGGDVTLGLNASYQDAWRIGLSYTHYYGAEGAVLNAANAFSYRQYLKDRDFIALSVRRTF